MKPCEHSVFGVHILLVFWSSKLPLACPTEVCLKCPRDSVESQSNPRLSLGPDERQKEPSSVSMPRRRLGKAQSGIRSRASEVPKELRFWFVRTWLFPAKRLESSVPRLLCDGSVILLRYPVFPLFDIA